MKEGSYSIQATQEQTCNTQNSKEI